MKGYPIIFRKHVNPAIQVLLSTTSGTTKRSLVVRPFPFNQKVGGLSHIGCLSEQVYMCCTKKCIASGHIPVFILTPEDPYKQREN